MHGSWDKTPVMLLLLPLGPPSHSTPMLWSNPVSKASTLIPLDPTKTPLKLLRVKSRREKSTGIERVGRCNGVNQAWLQGMLQLRMLVYGMQRRFKDL